MADSGDHASTEIKAEAPQATTADQTAASTVDDIEAVVDVDTEMQTDSQTMDNSSNAKSAANANMDGSGDDAPTVPQIETRMPAKKDVALRDFLSKMDEYAPIVSSLSPSARRKTLRPRPLLLTLLITDPRRSYELLPHPRRSAPTTSNPTSLGSTTRTRCSEVHCRHRSRRIPILAHQVHQHHIKQSFDWTRWCCRLWNDADRRRRCQG